MKAIPSPRVKIELFVVLMFEPKDLGFIFTTLAPPGC